MSESSWTQDEVNKIISEISKRSMTDQAFRDKVLENPNAVIEEIAGKSVPEGFQIEIIESKPGIDHTFVLPSPTTDQLNDQELDSVAAGRCSSYSCGDQFRI